MKEKEARQLRRKENSLLRDRLEAELTREKLHHMFQVGFNIVTIKYQ
jgi:hypothetical protein